MEKVTILDFYADWCKPCKAVEPILSQLSADNFTRTILKKINIEDDDKEELIYQHKVRNIPTVVMYMPGKEPIKLVGTNTYEEYEKSLKKLLHG